MRTLLILCTLLLLSGAHAHAEIDFTPARNIVSCGPNTVYFVYNNDIQPDLLFWDFGDGTASSVSNPSHYYNDPGVYTVKLVVIKNNVRDSVVKEGFVTILPAPLAQLIVKKGSEDRVNEFLFISTSLHNADSFNRVFWMIGADSLDGDTVKHLFKVEGEYEIKLTVINNKGCSDESTTRIKVTNNQIEPVGMDEEMLTGASVFPNPAVNQVEINLPEGYLAAPVVQLMDATGRMYTTSYRQDSRKITVDTSLLTAGVYQLILSVGTERAVKRLVVMH